MNGAMLDSNNRLVHDSLQVLYRETERVSQQEWMGSLDSAYMVLPDLDSGSGGSLWLVEGCT